MCKKEVRVQTFAPHSGMRDYVVGYRALRGVATPPMATDCRLALNGGPAMVFNLAGPVTCVADDAPPRTLAGDFVIGSLAKQVRFRAMGALSLFAVRFSPDGLYPFFSMPPVDMSGLCMEMEEIWELMGLGVSERIHGAPAGPRAKIRAFEDFFFQRMRGFRAHSRDVEAAVGLIRAHKGQISVAGLADELRISPRHLVRKFIQRIGVPPKHLCRIFRLKNALAHLGAMGREPAAVALDCGYYDQAHFNHEFKRFTEQSPVSFLERFATRSH